MTALVIGGNRFFGKKLVHLFLNKGVEVTVLNRGQTRVTITWEPHGATTREELEEYLKVI